MKLVTQDGRTIELSREYDLFVCVSLKTPEDKAKVSVTTFTKPVMCNDSCFPDRTLVERYGIVGEYSTDTGSCKARDAIKEAWANGAEEFVMPEDTHEKSLAEQFDDLCKEHNLMTVTINELGYSSEDYSKNWYLAKNTDEFERRGILVAGEEYDAFAGHYAESFRKWKKIQAEKNSEEMTA